MKTDYLKTGEDEFSVIDTDEPARAVFLASLPTGDKGAPVPGHTTWEQLGPRAKDRYRRMAVAANQLKPL